MVNVPVDITEIIFSSTNTLIALGAPSGVVIAVLTFVWRSMRNNIINDVNKKIDKSDLDMCKRLDKQDVVLSHLSKGHDGIAKNIEELKTALYSIGETTTKFILSESSMTTGLKSDIHGHETRITNVEESIRTFMNKFLK